MNKEKLKEIHSKRFLGDRFKEVNFEGQNNLQFFLDENDPLNKGDQVSGKCFTNKSFNHWWYYREKLKLLVWVLIPKVMEFMTRQRLMKKVETIGQKNNIIARLTKNGKLKILN